jgi:hypothetical protein
MSGGLALDESIADSSLPKYVDGGIALLDKYTDDPFFPGVGFRFGNHTGGDIEGNFSVDAGTPLGSVVSEGAVLTQITENSGAFSGHAFMRNIPLRSFTAEDIFKNRAKDKDGKDVSHKIYRDGPDERTLKIEFQPHVKIGGVDIPIPLDEVAKLFGVDHFNWKQTVTPFAGVQVYKDPDGTEMTRGDRGNPIPHAHLDPIVNVPGDATTRYLLVNTDSVLNRPPEREYIVKYGFDPDRFDYYLQEGSGGIQGVNNSKYTTEFALKFEDSPSLPVSFDTNDGNYESEPPLTHYFVELVGVLPDGTESPIKTGVHFSYKSNLRHDVPPECLHVSCHGRLFIYESTEFSPDLPPIVAGNIFDLQVFLPGLESDYNDDGTVDAADYAVWRKGLATGAYTQDDYNTWRANFGATADGAAAGARSPNHSSVPEPTALALAALALVLLVAWRKKLHRRARSTPTRGGHKQLLNICPLSVRMWHQPRAAAAAALVADNATRRTLVRAAAPLPVRVARMPGKQHERRPATRRCSKPRGGVLSIYGETR